MNPPKDAKFALTNITNVFSLMAVQVINHFRPQTKKTQRSLLL